MADRVTAGKKNPGKTSLKVVPKVMNLETARFECTYGRGCEGLCCQNSRPPIDEPEEKQIKKVLKRALPLMRPKAARLVEKQGFVSNRKKGGGHSLRVVDTWCVFFHKGCILHQLGAEEGDTLKYKPVTCALFPVERYGDDGWYIRQAEYSWEQWDLHCLKSTPKTPLAKETLGFELGLARECDEGKR